MVIFDKAVRVLGHAELFEPLRNSLHRTDAPIIVQGAPSSRQIVEQHHRPAGAAGAQRCRRHSQLGSSSSSQVFPLNRVSLISLIGW
jgi:hypothetical protein